MRELLKLLRQEIEEGKYPIVLPAPGRLAALNNVSANQIREKVYKPLRDEGIVARRGKNYYVVSR